MNGADQMGSLVDGIQALVTLAVGVCSIVAMTRKQPPIETTISKGMEKLRDNLGTEVGKIYDDMKKNHSSVQVDLKDHEGRIAKLEGTCQSRNSNGNNCSKL